MAKEKQGTLGMRFPVASATTTIEYTRYSNTRKHKHGHNATVCYSGMGSVAVCALGVVAGVVAWLEFTSIHVDVTLHYAAEGK